MMADNRLYYVVTAVVVTIVVKFLMGLYKARRRMIRLKNKGLVSENLSAWLTLVCYLHC